MQILPCPFCGSVAVLTHVNAEDVESANVHMAVQCQGADCWATIESYLLDDPVTDCIRAWNKRVKP